MISLVGQRQCLRHVSSHGRRIHTSPSRSSHPHPAWFAGGVFTGVLAAFLYKRNTQCQKLKELSPSHFTSTTLTSSVDSGKESKLLQLNLPSESFPKTSPIAIWAVYVKDSDIMVERPYTPLESLNSSGDMLFWVKKYTHGEVGRWLHSKSVGEKVEIRGPEQTWSWQEGAWDNVIMIGGGTGVAPFYQLLHRFFSNQNSSEPTTNFMLLHSHRSTELPPDFVLDNLHTWSTQYPKHLKVDIFVDKFNQASTRTSQGEGRISKTEIELALKHAAQRSGKTIVLVCGPESMVNEIAGPKGRDESQGPIGGTLGQLRNYKFEVFKL